MWVCLVLFASVTSSSEFGFTSYTRSDPQFRSTVSKSQPKSTLKFIQNQKPLADMPDFEDDEDDVDQVVELKPFKFTQSSYSGSIPENSPGKVHVVPDSKMGIYVNQTLFGPGGPYTMRFRIKAGDPEDFFKAEAELVGDFIFLIVRTRTSNLNVLNRERTPNYELDIRARVREARGTKGSRRPQGNRIKGFPDPKTILRVTVVDTNDLNPFFQPPRYTFSVPEDTPLHTSIGQVHAEDADDGINGEIYYSILGSYLPSIFAVDPITGILSLTRPLSYKEEPTHRLTIVAQDRGAKPAYASGQADTAAVTVHVEQVSIYFDAILEQAFYSSPFRPVLSFKHLLVHGKWKFKALGVTNLIYKIDVVEHSGSPRTLLA